MNEENVEVETLNFTKSDFLRLKEFFRSIINSNRRFEKISTIEELYTVLDDRDALTDDVIVRFEPNFQKFILHQRKKANSYNELIVPQKVVDIITENYPGEWEILGQHLKLTEEQLRRCENVPDVLNNFTENCKGISRREMTFRLNRALEKSNKGNLKLQVMELMIPKSS